MIQDPNNAIVLQLKRIADAVNRPGPSPWLQWIRTLASFVAGLATVFLSQQFRVKASDRREQNAMRRVVYLEISKNFLELEAIVSPYWKQDGTPVLNGMRFNVMNQGLFTFDGESHMVANAAVFYQLEEGEVLKWIYDWFHKLDVPKLDGSKPFGLAELRGPLSFFSDCYRTYPALRRQLKRVLPRASFARIEGATAKYHHVFSIEELVDSGLMRVVDDDGSETS